MKWPRYTRAVAIGLGIVALQALLVWVYRSVERARHTAPAVFRAEHLRVRPAPELELLAPDGSRSPLAQLRGRPVLLHFWATWCLPCRDELPGLLQLADDFRQRGELQLVALSVDDDWTVVRNFFGGSLPDAVARDANGDAATRFEVSVFPDTYLLDAAGILRVRFGGARDWTTPAARDALLSALRELR
jgi:thiol-disulfide isomerase/thioredoxin